jgi:hypothetical protein
LLISLAVVLSVLVGLVPAVRAQYHHDRAGFWGSMRLLAIFLIYVFAGIGIVLALLSGPQSSATAIAATVFVLAWILYGALWLTRLAPRYRELPAFIDKRPSGLDYAIVAVMTVSLGYALVA